jgi:hypothetical protein
MFGYFHGRPSTSLLRDRFGELLDDDEQELRAKVVDQKEMGSLRREWSMPFLVEVGLGL